MEVAVSPAPTRSSVIGRRRVILICCAFFLGAYHFISSAAMYPVPGGDAAVFLPGAINLKAGRGLTNQLWEAWPDPTGQHRFLDHPPLFQLVVAALMAKADAQSAFKVLSIFGALSVILYAVLLSTAEFGRRLITSRLGFLILILSEFALAFVIFTDTCGRPETLSTLVLAGAIAMVIWVDWKWSPICLGGAAGIAAAIHPVNGILVAYLVAVTFLVLDPIRTAIRKIIFAAAVTLAVFWCLLRLSPHPAQLVLDSVLTHAVLANEIEYSRSDFVTFYLTLAPWAGLYLLGLFLVLGWCGVYVWHNTCDRLTRFLRFLGLSSAGLAFYYFSIRRPCASYYLSMLVPAVIVLAIFLAGRDGVESLRPRSSLILVLAAFFGIFTLCLFRDVGLFVNYSATGVSFRDAQKAFKNVAGSTNQEISVSESLWVLASDFERIRIIEHGTVSGELVVLQQTQRGSLSPPIIPGYRLLWQSFISHPPTLVGVPIAHTMPGYSFAVFARNNGVAGAQATRAPN